MLTKAEPFLLDARSAWGVRTTGWERYVREIAREFQARSAPVDVSIFPIPSLAQRVFTDLWSVPRRASKYKVAHYPTFPPARVPSPRTELVYTLHDLTWWRYPDTATLVGRLYYRRLLDSVMSRLHLVTHTRAIADEAAEYFGLDRSAITVAYPGLTLAVQGAEPTLPPPKPYLLFVGTFEPRKNLSRLLEAFRRSSVASSFDLLLVGRLGWGKVPAEGVEVRDSVSDEELAMLYRQASGLLLPSLYEGFGLPIIEALSAGIPVACSDIPAHREVAGGHAVFFDPHSVDAMSSAIEHLPNVEVAEEGISWARAFTWGRTAETLLAVYSEIASN